MSPDASKAVAATQSAPDQLPSGRHGLPRRIVARHQRERILDGLTQAVCELGYAKTTIADIVLFARLSRRTFYDYFSDKEDCFLAAYDRGIADIAACVTEAARTREQPGEQLSAGIAAFIEKIADNPALARLCLVEVVAAGPRALERRERVIRAFARGMLDIARRHSDSRVEVPATTAELVIGGLLQIVNARVIRGEVGSLRADLPELLHCALVPFCGHADAADLVGLIAPRDTGRNLVSAA